MLPGYLLLIHKSQDLNLNRNAPPVSILLYFVKASLQKQKLSGRSKGFLFLYSDQRVYNQIPEFIYLTSALLVFINRILTKLPVENRVTQVIEFLHVEMICAVDNQMLFVSGHQTELVSGDTGEGLEFYGTGVRLYTRLG